jgi:hypothetical protein
VNDDANPWLAHYSYQPIRLSSCASRATITETLWPHAHACESVAYNDADDADDKEYYHGK